MMKVYEISGTYDDLERALEVASMKLKNDPQFYGLKDEEELKEKWGDWVIFHTINVLDELGIRFYQHEE